MPDREERLRAQLEAVRAQALAIVATIDSLIGAPEEDHCCGKPEPVTSETYTTRTVRCRNCGTILSQVSLEKKGEDHA